MRINQFFALILFFAGAILYAANLQVQVSNTAAREIPSFLAGTIMELHYGQKVEVIREQGDWRLVKIAGSSAQGWVHASALTDRKIELEAGDAVSGTASSDELALAGKGFSSEVEAAFRAENQNLDYGPINNMESIKVSAEESTIFLSEGGIIPEGGVI